MMKTKHYVIILCFLLITLFLFSLTKGSFALSISDIFHILLGQSTDFMKSQVFFNLRFSRVMMAVIAGLALGIAGAVYQMVFSNPLASPDLTGVATGSSLGAALAIVLGAGTPYEMMSGAFVVGMLSLGFVLLLVKLTGVHRTMTYLLAGIVISSVGDAFIMLLKYMADPLGELAAIEFWTMGSLASMTLEKMMMSLIGVMIPMLLILLCHRQITMLSLGDENATYLGLNTKTFKIFIFILTTWMVASVVALTGVISFVGLIAPHIAYLLLHKRTGAFFICSGFIGAILILVGDLLARCLIPGGELPLSILTIFLASPVLVFYMYKQRGKLL
ncbi:MAG: iron ABC transporter permease [Longibaculum muris]|uniref:Iron complex transport system permease protein n=1 Tax=Longibaculum muris TaxID=1796628 RepID=A0A4R3ZB41_9FIRM|nr:iron ABC transporter permease [Longibaculum muris]KXU51884.1 iron chelate uptake ABC transporter, FeCT family, permease protein [Candidatus Stoquefichus sp. KLE1796]MCR1887060.1 iron ABC transporter permease [Longibaculum muris]MED9811570.1 iron ABC transporter permease [Longibaculum muris]TCW03091.1 iron complex transport system permease protein [Longibaculum muris]